MMKVFLDVGGHEGQTLEEVLKPKYDWDWIHCFEPMLEQYMYLVEHFQDERLQIHNYGLADFSGKANLYGSNDIMEASLYPDKNDADETIVTECNFVEVSEIFEWYLASNDICVMKLNCEGGEIPILNNLIDTGHIWNVTNVMIDFDIRKVSGMEHEEQKILDRMKAIGFDHYSLCDDVMVGPTHQDRIANWLQTLS